MSLLHIVCRFIPTIFLLMPATGFAQSMGDLVRTVSFPTTAPTRLGDSNFTPWPGRATVRGLRFADANSCLSSGNKLCGNGACYEGMTTTCCRSYPNGVAACENGAACCGAGCCGPNQVCDPYGRGCYTTGQPDGPFAKPNPSGALPITPPVGAPVPVRVAPPPAAVAPPPAGAPVPVRVPPPAATLPTPKPVPSAPIIALPTPSPTLPAPASPPPETNWIACVACTWNDPDGTARAVVGCSGEQKTEEIADSWALQDAQAKGGQSCRKPVAVSSGCIWAASGQGGGFAGTGGGITPAAASADCQTQVPGGTCGSPVGGCLSVPAALLPPRSTRPAPPGNVGPGCLIQNSCNQ